MDEMAGVRILPALFNTDMVRALLDGRKTVTRRVVKPQPKLYGLLKQHWNWNGIKRPYNPGDILYVREAVNWMSCTKCDDNLDCDEGINYKGDWGCFNYRTDYGKTEDDSFPPSMLKWRPSIHMPKEAARIFLRVMDVRAERLQEITKEGVLKEGVNPCKSLPERCNCHWAVDGCREKPCANRDAYIDMRHTIPFSELWDSTVRAADWAVYGWAANPWVWVIEFERCEKPDEFGH